ncbi:MAG: amidohydrolase family protein, partial [Gemmatimonadales bacterium]|nr:amidohydrolase family protein [Gemmatimonadales bacterium]
MPSRLVFVAAFFAVAAPPLAGCQATSPAGAPLLGVPESRPAAFVDVHVVTMTGSAPLLHQTVLVRDGRIVTVGSVNDVPVPPDVLQIDGLGRRWLVPGLADMHVHVFDREEFVLHLANGITTVRNLAGYPLHLAWRDSLVRGLFPGPRLVTAGRILDGDPPTRSTNFVVLTPEGATAEVSRQAVAGYDFIKVYDNISPAVYTAIVAEATRHGLSVVGHLPTPVGLTAALGSGGQREIEHLEELLPLFDDGRSEQGLDSIALAIAAAGVVVTPTMVVFQSALDQSLDWAAVRGRAEMRFVSPETRRTWGWEEAGGSRSGNAQAIARYTRTTQFFYARMLPALHRAGVCVLAGSDAPIPALIPGFALYDELRLFERSGIPPLEVLRIATAGAADALGLGARRGR